MLTDKTLEVSSLLMVSSPGTQSGSEVGPGLFRKRSRYALSFCQLHILHFENLESPTTAVENGFHH